MLQAGGHIPTHGSDGRYLGSTIGQRTADFGYLAQVAQAVDRLGYAGALLPTGRFCEDAWITASALIPLTQRMKFLVAVRPGLMAPLAAARMAATFDRISNGRILINVVTGGSDADMAAERYLWPCGPGSGPPLPIDQEEPVHDYAHQDRS